MWIETISDLKKLDGLAPTIIEAVVEDVTGEPFEMPEPLGISDAINRLRGKAARDALDECETNDIDRHSDYTSKKQARHAAIFEGVRDDVADLVNVSLARLSGRASFKPDRESDMATKTTARPKLKNAAARRTKIMTETPREEMLAARDQERARAKAAGEPYCRLCGCTDLAGCSPDEGGPCAWANAEQNLCTVCDAKRHTPATPDASSMRTLPAGICAKCGTAVAEGVTCQVCGGLRRQPMTNGVLPSSLAALNGEVVRGDPPATAADEAAAASHNEDRREIPISLIDPSPYQRRRDFGTPELDQLAASIRRRGVLADLIVRPQGDRYELVAGERRQRAAAAIGLATVPCKVRDLTDAEAAEINADENFERKDLNPIERAETLQMLLETTGLTQEQLGERYGHQQAWVSNHLRLLELPDDWRDRIISQEISATHARALLRWKHRPKVLKEAAALLKQRSGDAEAGPVTVREFAELVCDAAVDVSRDFGEWSCTIRLQDLDQDVRTKLDIEHVEYSWGGGAERAFNVKLFDKLNNDAKSQAAQREQAKAANASASPRRATAATAKSKASKGPTSRPHEFVVGQQLAPWLAGEVRKRIKKTDRELCLRLLLGWDLCLLGADAFFQSHKTARTLLGMGGEGHLGDDELPEAWQRLASATPARLGQVMFEMVQIQFTTQALDMNARVLAAILRQVGGDPLSYRLTEDDVELYPDEDLRQMLRAHADALPPKAKRADLVAAALQHVRDLPEEFAAILGPPQKPAKSTKAKAR